MSTLEMITASEPSIIRPAWAQEMDRSVFGMLVEGNTLSYVAEKLDKHAGERSLIIAEVARVSHDGAEAVFARCVDRPHVAPAHDPA